MKIIVISIHPVGDNRILKHLGTVCIENDVEYLNMSTSSTPPNDFPHGVIMYQYKHILSKKHPFTLICFLCKCMRRIRKTKPEIVHIHDPILFPLFLVAKKIGASTVFDKHEFYENGRGLAARVYIWLEMKFNQYTDGVVYVNKRQNEYLQRFQYVSKKLIPNYQSKNMYENTKRQQMVSREVRFIYVGDLANCTRDSSRMLNIMDKIMSQSSSVRFVLGGVAKDLEIKDKIALMSKKYLGFEYNGYMPYSSVAIATVNSDIGLLFQKECGNTIGSSPNKIYEYLIAGIAVVSIGRYEDWKLVDGNAGFAFDFSVSDEEIISAIKSIIVDRHLLYSLKEKSKELGKKFTWEDVGKRYLEMYTELRG